MEFTCFRTIYHFNNKSFPLLQDIQPCDNNLVLHHLSLAAHYYYSDNRNAAR